MSSTHETLPFWQVFFTRKAEMMARGLPDEIHDALFLLKEELEKSGPRSHRGLSMVLSRGRGKKEYHCHLNKGRPRYVAVWLVDDNNEKIIEVCFAGTQEKERCEQF